MYGDFGLSPMPFLDSLLAALSHAILGRFSVSPLRWEGDLLLFLPSIVVCSFISNSPLPDGALLQVSVAVTAQVNYISFVLSSGYCSVAVLGFSPFRHLRHMCGTSIFSVPEEWNPELGYGFGWQLQDAFPRLVSCCGALAFSSRSCQLPGRLLQLAGEVSSYLQKSEAMFLYAWLLLGESEPCRNICLTHKEPYQFMLVSAVIWNHSKHKGRWWR